MAQEVNDPRRVVLKLGTNTLCDPNGMPDITLMSALAKQMQTLRADGHQFIIVTSGAIGSGRSALRLPETPIDVPTRQACAAVGQHRLMQCWDEALSRHKLHAAQILVSADTFDRRKRYVNLRNCMESLLKMGAIPIVNENDVIATDEISETFGDNDRLGALVAAKMEADLYIILSDVPGLYDKPPHMGGAKLVPQVSKIDDKVLAMAGEKPGKKGKGGMGSKLKAAQYLTESGIPVTIAYGREDLVLTRIIHPEDEPRPGTWFDAIGHRDGIQRWITATTSHGFIDVDEGAVKALHDGYHLLPAGVCGVEGQWPVESVVEIRHAGKPIARAVSQFSSSDLHRCMGKQSDEVKEILGVDASANVTRKGRITMT